MTPRPSPVLSACCRTDFARTLGKRKSDGTHGRGGFWKEEPMLRLTPSALLAPNATGFVIWDVKATGSYMGKKQENLYLPGITPGGENRDGLLLLERVDL